jgi:hypothetical protein
MAALSIIMKPAGKILSATFSVGHIFGWRPPFAATTMIW